MKTLPGNGKVSGFTLIELLVVIAVIAILAAMLLPANTHGEKAKIPWCMSNQKQIAIALMMFQGDHDGKYPWQVSTTNNGSLEQTSNGLATDQFLTIGTYLGNRPQVLICPADKGRLTAINYSTLTNTNISYFLNLDTVTNINSILTGDRNLELIGGAINSGIFVQTTNSMLKWSEGFHQAQGKPAGVFSFADGHAQYIRQDYLNRTLQNQPLATNQFCIP
jgi:prepilin-type N-terminal cleavage/methylation domain-containing protein